MSLLPFLEDVFAKTFHASSTASRKQNCTPASPSSCICRDPYSGEVVFQRPYLSLDDAVEKVLKTQRAFKIWKSVPLGKRIAHIQKGCVYFEDHKAELAKEITKAMGKPLSQSLFEIEAGVSKMKQLCTQAPKALETEFPPSPDEGKTRYEVQRVPKGVIEVIAPWNYPVFTALNGVIPALLSGNAVVLKHETLPAVGEAFEKAFGTFRCASAGAPGSSVGGPTPVEGLVSHLLVNVETSSILAVERDEIKHRVFTGSVGGGRGVMQTVGERAQNTKLTSPFITCSLELGGCDSCYIARDADLETAVPFIVNIGRLHNSGQSCCNVKRLLVHSEVMKEVEAKLCDEFGKTVLGDPSDENTTIGPLYGGKERVRFLWDLLLDAKKKGAKKILVRGEDVTALDLKALRLKVLMASPGSEDAFFAPTIVMFESAPPTSSPSVPRLLQEESFGPLLPVVSVGGDEEAVAIANGTSFALTHSIWTTDSKRARRYVDAIEAGTVMVNWCNDVHPQIVWSGQRRSGNGQGAMGSEGFRVLTYPKSVILHDI
uniref:Aldehyde dehydrogenase domain-containing protein n=1 Tax=Chromera velia CCMP2878 TaxID=1169474 RepID=A0A0G4I907_9ALVE|eukprot:Cvel_2021.t1-p1 / transcript=Cvel_2021.t1 / gene=Cvel_2021 / organism=Chromera_velia_CCMP2878 / gene_product=Succinate-semialdehyde dehydrogenase [NADP( )], putative / transcript_product=Succinate-semialdehyde dehydrogenase [NADP( )], putative / location=Cvel_scaffold77:113495-116475(+) / protein_length=543 / sequence_SO=supercontig / SO=protein_coding / is_pseudo=false